MTLDSDGNATLQFFKDRYKREIYLDEKNYFLDVIRMRMRYCSLQLSHPNARPIKTKQQIPHLMFVAALGMPQMSPDGNSYFDGKIGCWPFAKLKHATKNSINRLRGELEIVGTYADADSFFEMMTMKRGILQTMREKLPWLDAEPMEIILHDGELPPDHDVDVHEHDEDERKGFLQVMDNAPPHVGKTKGSIHKPNSERLTEWAKLQKCNVTFRNQPPQSPDLNLLDASIFRSLSRAACNYSVHAKTMGELFYNVQHTFEEYNEDNISRAIAFQFATYCEVLRALGGNEFNLPHTHIRARQKAGEFLIDFNVPKLVVQSAANHILTETKHFANNAQTMSDSAQGISQPTLKLKAESNAWNERVLKWEAILEGPPWPVAPFASQ